MLFLGTPHIIYLLPSYSPTVEFLANPQFFFIPSLFPFGLIFFSWLLVHKKLKLNLPQHIIHRVCQFIAYGWLNNDGTVEGDDFVINTVQQKK